MEYIRLKDVTLSTQYGYTAEETSKTEGVYKYLRITDIVPYFVDLDTVPYCSIPQKKVEQYLVKEGDILIARTGATTGYNYVVPKGIKNTVYASYLIRFNVDRSKILPSYLKYVLKSHYYYGFVNNYIGGSAQPGMNARVFGRFNLPYNSLPLQHRIASILSAYDNLIENNNKRIRLLEQTAENLYKEWFVRFRFPGHEKVEMENGLPKGWKYERLDTIASINMGQSPPSSFYNEEQKGLPFHQGVGSYGDIYLKDEIYSTQGAKVAESNSIIFSVRAPVGRINITLNKIYLGRGVAAINAINGNNGFLYWSLRSKFAKEDTIGNGAIFSSVTRDELGRQKMIVPDKSTVAKFESIANKMENLIRDITNQNKSLIRQRDLLLPRLMSGKLEVKE